MVDFERFYGEWAGHRVEDLEVVYERVAFVDEEMHGKLVRRRRKVIWLCGDSSLDNKYWILHRPAGKSCNGYENIFEKSVRDVAYWINKILCDQRRDECFDRAMSREETTSPLLSGAVCINCSVEATTLGSRIGWRGKLKLQDIFLRDRLHKDDVLVVSVGGNDIALAPSFRTVLSLIGVLVFGNSASVKDNGSGCGTSYMKWLFKNGVEEYLRKLTTKVAPQTIVPCMIYYPDMNHKSPSWANAALSLIGYNRNPTKVQNLIDAMYLHATSLIELPGSRALPVALADALDGVDHGDYECRVEPSVGGGKKLATLILDTIFRKQ